MIIEGRSETPVYLFIQENTVEFRNAEHLLGRRFPKNRPHPPEVATAGCRSFDWSAEKIWSKFPLMSDDRAAGRCGGGAVWGSKNLIAVAVKGNQKVQAADPDRLNVP